jgi:oligopeptide/dipeptide ABC transporter ATP-binding protein
MSDAILSARGLSAEFPGGARPVDGVSFDLREGRTLGLVGESGSGKTTLARLLLRLEQPSAGSIRVDGEDWLGLSPRALRRNRWKVQMVFQDPVSSLNPRLRVGESVGEPLALREGLSGAMLAGRVAELLGRVGLDAGAARRYPHEFSGGERQRIAIARALAPGPRIVVCDEPVSALDSSVAAQIENLLRDLQAERGISYLFISHDLPVVGRMASRIAVMYAGQIVEEAERGLLIEAPLHPYTQALVAGTAIAGEPASPGNPPSGCRFHPRCPIARPRCGLEAPPEAEAGELRRAACFYAGEVAYSSKL